MKKITLITLAILAMFVASSCNPDKIKCRILKQNTIVTVDVGCSGLKPKDTVFLEVSHLDGNDYSYWHISDTAFPKDTTFQHVNFDGKITTRVAKAVVVSRIE
jgi:hypothetical protein